MNHQSDSTKHLSIVESYPKSESDFDNLCSGISDVCVVTLPSANSFLQLQSAVNKIGEIVAHATQKLQNNATLIILGEAIDLIEIQSTISVDLHYQLWIAIKKASIINDSKNSLPNQHFGALVYTRYKGSLKHTKTRIEYSYCPVCKKTTKDYGGKKHTYHEYGTLISDVWRDIACDLDGDLSPIFSRFADLFGLDDYQNLNVIHLNNLNLSRPQKPLIYYEIQANPIDSVFIDEIANGDCIEKLRNLPDNCIDFAFIDPPYNLQKKYSGYSDDLSIQEYFKWCDTWIFELSRVIKPGRTIALLNIPIWSIRHFLFLKTILQFQNWIVWDALSFPVRLIMPAHYSILCFTKGESRELPCFTGESKSIELDNLPKYNSVLEPLADGFCLRENCVNTRKIAKINDRTVLSDLWGDIHRLKHNSRRVDHPTQLPPVLMYRLISIFTKPGELVIDCFNGSGTTTLTAHQLHRHFYGIELSEKYWQLSKARHQEIYDGLDPFRKMERELTSKNSRVPRLKKQVYIVPKKNLQLEVRKIAHEIGHIPTREEVEMFSRYPIKYYDEYFISWGEATAAARTTGMNEFKVDDTKKESEYQLQLLEKKSKYPS